MDYFHNLVNLPNLDGPLVGRQAELLTLHQTLAGGGCVAIVGVGGQGKTALVWAYFKEVYGEAGFAKPIWHTVRGDGTDLTSIATYLEIDFAGTRPEQTAEQIRANLMQQARLLVLDNFEDAIREGGQLSPDLEALWPKIVGLNGPSRVLITSRDLPKLADNYFPSLGMLPLHPLADNDGADLLRQRGLNNQPENLLRSANQRAAGNPLALTLLANLVKRGHALPNLLKEGGNWDVNLQENPLLLVKTWDLLLNENERETLKALAVLRPPLSRPLLDYVLQPPMLPKQTEGQRDELLRRLEHDLGLVSSPGYQLHGLFRRFVLDKKLIEGEAEIVAWTAALYFQFEEMPHLRACLKIELGS